MTSQAPPSSQKQQNAIKDPSRRVWSWQTWLTLALCLALIVGVSIWSKSLDQANRQVSVGDAPQMLTAFLDAVTTGDDAWRDVATESYVQHLEGRKPVYGDPATAKLLDLSVTYTADKIEYVKTRADYFPSNPVGSDLAQTVVHFTYEYTVLGESFTSTVQQAVFITRPYYYDGSETPTPADVDHEREPSAIGPWQVSNMRSPITIRENFSTLETVSDYVATAPVSEPYACTTEALIFVELSETARRDGHIDPIVATGNGSSGRTTILGPNSTDIRLATFVHEFAHVLHYTAVPETFAFRNTAGTEGFATYLEIVAGVGEEPLARSDVRETIARDGIEAISTENLRGDQAWVAYLAAASYYQFVAESGGDPWELAIEAKANASRMDVAAKQQDPSFSVEGWQAWAAR